MTISIMQGKIKKITELIFGVLFWVLIWQLGAMLLAKPYLLPDVFETFRALGELLLDKSFYRTVFLTLLRVISGLLLGVFVGSVLAFVTEKYRLIRALVTPIVSVIKSTPVASFIIILWILMDASSLVVFIAFLMVFPIVWQNLSDGFSAIDKELSEVCQAFEFSYIKRLRLLVFPTLWTYFRPALITSVGLAWKSEIAAEIIAYTRSSIGAMINDAKYDFQTSKVFALTIVVVIFSILLEALMKFLMEGAKK